MSVLSQGWHVHSAYSSVTRNFDNYPSVTRFTNKHAVETLVSMKK